MEHFDLEIINYDTTYLDAIDGSVTDGAPAYAMVPTPNHAASAPPSRGNLVRPMAQHPQDGALAGVMAGLIQQPASNAERDAYAIQHMHAMSERSSPTERNRAKLVLMAGWIAIAGIIALGLHKAMLIDSRMAWICFVVAFGYGVYKSNRDENAHSPAGVERHKTDVYGAIRSAEIRAADKAHERNHATFNRVIDRVYGGRHVQDRNPSQR